MEIKKQVLEQRLCKKNSIIPVWKNAELRGPDGCKGFAALYQNKLAGFKEYNKKDDLIEMRNFI